MPPLVLRPLSNHLYANMPYIVCIGGSVVHSTNDRAGNSIYKWRSSGLVPLWSAWTANSTTHVLYILRFYQIENARRRLLMDRERGVSRRKQKLSSRVAARPSMRYSSTIPSKSRGNKWRHRSYWFRLYVPLESQAKRKAFCVRFVFLLFRLLALGCNCWCSAHRLGRHRMKTINLFFHQPTPSKALLSNCTSQVVHLIRSVR